MIDKPAYGHPCNSCGRCCAEQLCPLGAAHFKLTMEQGPCPALQDNIGGTRSCGLVDNPESYALVRTLINGRKAMIDAALYLIGAGAGCDARLDGEVDDPFFRHRTRAVRALKRGTLRRSLKAWGVGVISGKMS